MNKITAQIRDLTERQLIALISLGSILMTAWIMHIQQGWVTDDSILYFEVARLFAAREWQQGFALYGWPLYPALIALVHKLTGLTIQHSAQLWNVVFFTLTSYSFLTLIRLAGGHKQTIVWGGALLFSSPYIVGDVLPMLLRDEGFWAFFLASLGFLLKFHRTAEFKWALYWQFCMIIAMLFRIEALVFLLFTPLFMLLDSTFGWKERLLRYSKTQVLTLSAFISLILLVAFSRTLQPQDLGRIQEVITFLPRAYAQITQGLVHKSQLMGEQVLGKYLDDYGLLSILLTLTCITIIKIAGSAGLPALLSLATPQKAKFYGLQNDARKLIFWVMAIGTVIASVMILSTFILSSRYVIPLVFMLLVLAAFALFNMQNSVKGGKSRLHQSILALILLLVCINLIKNLLPPSEEHNYEQQAVTWLKKNSPPQASVFINNAKLRYYAGQAYTDRPDPWPWTLQAIENNSIHEFDYLVLSLNGKNIEQQKYLSEVLTHHRLVNKFSRGPKKVVLIYAKKP